ncbi:histone deacetylase 11 isoform X1 [Centruroides vittatus]|uniref:histone deacetylase 11 isoform X1 n=1 Tax=Centruroides vittatus TaxID=120091 RepID=UPI0035109E41
MGRDICRKFIKLYKNSEDRSKGVYFDIQPSQLPVIYSPTYNIGFFGLEKLHPFDSGKWGRIYQFLKDGKMIIEGQTVEPEEATDEELMVVHSQSYLNKLKWSAYVARITEVPCVALLPNSIVQRRVLKPFRTQTGGSILAGKLAVERGWAINIGGGFHHCYATNGGGFCAYADITLTIKFLFHNLNVKSAMIVDLDAHQGNGHERDFMNDRQVYILDVYNRNIYPGDKYAKEAITRKVELRPMTEDTEYLEKISIHLEGALNEFTPDIIIYNAGTDILEGDPLGGLSVSAKGIIARDEIVFQKARERKIPIVMLTSGGYQRVTARIIANSILNLFQKGYLKDN